MYFSTGTKNGQVVVTERERVGETLGEMKVSFNAHLKKSLPYIPQSQVTKQIKISQLQMNVVMHKP